MKRTLLFCLLLISFFGVNSLPAQIKGFSSMQEQGIFGSEGGGMSELKEILGSETSITGTVVDAKFYKVGPGDVLLLQNLSSFPEQSPMVITPENSIVVPRIGIVSLLDMTLEEARDVIIKAIRKVNSSAIAAVTLYKPRNVIITIEGDVNFPGTYVFPATFRISTAIRSANQTKLSQQLPPEQVYRILLQRDELRDKRRNTQKSGIIEEEFYSTRNINVYRSNGVSTIADINRAYARGSAEFDPYLQEGDVIYVPFKPAKFSYIEISGAVKRPCKLLYKQGDMASDLLRYAFGATMETDLANINLYIPENNLKTNLNVDNNFILTGKDYELSPGSIITVGKKTLPQKTKLGVVAIAGEVANPGSFTIDIGKTRLKDVIELAGGFAEKAYLPLARVIRYGKHHPETDDKTKEYLRYIQYSDLKPRDTIRTKIDVQMKEPIVSTDFVSLFENNSQRDNVLLDDGDLIVIPVKPTHIFVWGQVNKPGYIEFQDGKTMKWYIEQAGGAASGSDKGRSRIIRGKNKVWVEGENNVFVYAGDEIYVPHEIIVDPSETLQKYATIASILGATAAILQVILWASMR